jgi:hypothetical protein
MNQLYLVGGASTVALCISLYMQSCRVTAILHTNLTNSPLLPNGTMNQLYLVKGGPGIIALHSFLYLQPCRVTTFGISPCLYKSHKFAAVAQYLV